jgi:hypothetical protein
MVRNVKQSLYRPEKALRVVPVGSGSHTSRESEFGGDEEIRFTRRPSLHPKKYSWHSLLLEAESTPGPECGRNDSNNTIVNRAHDLPACSAVPETTALPRAADVNMPMLNNVDDMIDNYVTLYSTLLSELIQ